MTLLHMSDLYLILKHIIAVQYNIHIAEFSVLSGITLLDIAFVNIDIVQC